MNQALPSDTPVRFNPVFSMAGVMPGGSEMAWKTAYPNPDAAISAPKAVGHGPSFSMAGVMPGCAETTWRTAMPNPTVDVLDAHGHVVTRIEAAARVELQPARRTRALHPARRRTSVLALSPAA